MNPNSIYMLPDRTVIAFIRKYRYLETAVLEEGYRTIALIADNEALRQHLCNHWRSKEKQFGDFFLNLSHRSQIKLLRQWGLHDPDDAAYMKLDPKDYLFAAAPNTVTQLHKLLVFFLNHGVETCEAYRNYPEVRLTVPAPEGKRFGNSANWGDYILSLEDPAEVLTQIFHYNTVRHTNP